MNFKTILFDLGGVILNIDYGAPSRAFAALGIENFEQKFAKAAQNQLFDDLECGQITEPQFYDQMRRHSQLPLTNDQIMQAWNSILLDLPTDRLALLLELRKTHQLLLLSNTNSIHITAVYQYLATDLGINNGLQNYFDATYFSHTIGLRKPHKPVFEYVLAQHGLLPHEVLYIDDSPQHIATAQAMGIHSVLHNTNAPLRQTIEIGLGGGIIDVL